MKTIDFQDYDRNKIRVQHSSLATQKAFRIYIRREPSDTSDVCLHLTEDQATILIRALQDLMADE